MRIWGNALITASTQLRHSGSPYGIAFCGTIRNTRLRLTPKIGRRPARRSACCSQERGFWRTPASTERGFNRKGARKWRHRDGALAARVAVVLGLVEILVQLVDRVVCEMHELRTRAPRLSTKQVHFTCSNPPGSSGTTLGTRGLIWGTV